MTRECRRRRHDAAPGRSRKNGNIPLPPRVAGAPEEAGATTDPRPVRQGDRRRTRETEGTGPTPKPETARSGKPFPGSTAKEAVQGCRPRRGERGRGGREDRKSGQQERQGKQGKRKARQPSRYQISAATGRGTDGTEKRRHRKRGPRTSTEGMRQKGGRNDAPPPSGFNSNKRLHYKAWQTGNKRITKWTHASSGSSGATT